MRICTRVYASEAELREIERLRAAAPEPGLDFERACALEDLGWGEAAAQAYVALLVDAPDHLGSLTNLGALLFDRGDFAGAEPLFARAAEAHPDEPVARFNLARLLAERDAFADARAHYEAALRLRPGWFPAHHGLMLLCERGGDEVAAQRWRRLAYGVPACFVGPYRGTHPALAILLLTSGRGGDLVAHPFLDDRIVQTYTYVAESYDPAYALPPHHVLLNGIGDADACAPALEAASRIVAASAAPVVNDPAAVLQTGRASLPGRLAGIPDVVVPAVTLLARAEAGADALIAAGLRFPLLLRAPGYHGGRHFAYAGTARDVSGVLAGLPGERVFAIAFADTRSKDGWYRKYRVLFVGGRPYAAHLAIGADWKVHYFSAGMERSAEHRAEEATFLADPAAALGARAWAAVRAAGAALGLDYGGLDFGCDARGRVVAFEANATMSVAPPPPGALFAYRRPAYERIVDAMRALLGERAERGGYAGPRRQR